MRTCYFIHAVIKNLIIRNLLKSNCRWLRAAIVYYPCPSQLSAAFAFKISDFCIHVAFSPTNSLASYDVWCMRLHRRVSTNWWAQFCILGFLLSTSSPKCLVRVDFIVEKSPDNLLFYVKFLVATSGRIIIVRSSISLTLPISYWVPYKENAARCFYRLVSLNSFPFNPTCFI